MLSAVFSAASRTATNYFYLPVDEDTDDESRLIRPSKRVSWSSPRSSIPSCSAPTSIPSRSASLTQAEKEQQAVLDDVMSHDDLYRILGVSRSPDLDKLALRKAYFARCKACHPDKFPDNPDATRAFQKVSVAYDVLSKPQSRRLYDSRPSPSAPYDMFSSRPAGYADQTFRGCVIGVFNDFLDGDMEVVRNLLRTVNSLNPSVHLGDEGIDAILMTLEAVRQRALTCRTCVIALHSELCRLLEIQQSFRQLSYFDIRRRSHLTLQLARITLSLPFVVEQAILDQGTLKERPENALSAEERAIVPRRLGLVIRALVVVLERMESVLK